MRENRMMINNYDHQTGKYTEKTKTDKVKTLLPIIDQLVHPGESLIAAANNSLRGLPSWCFLSPCPI